MTGKRPRRRSFRRLPMLTRDHAAGCPACSFYRDGTVELCPDGRDIHEEESQ
jgi:hypothetical protein